MKLWITARTRSSLVKVTLAMAGTSIRCANSSTIWARRQVTTDPELRRTIRSNRLPSSLVISRTCTRSATAPPLDVVAGRIVALAQGQIADLPSPNRAKVPGGGTSRPKFATVAASRICRARF